MIEIRFNKRIFVGSRSSVASLYPSLDEYMGLNLQSPEVRQNLAVVPVPQYHAPAVISNRPTQTTGIYCLYFFNNITMSSVFK